MAQQESISKWRGKEVFLLFPSSYTFPSQKYFYGGVSRKSNVFYAYAFFAPAQKKRLQHFYLCVGTRPHIFQHFFLREHYVGIIRFSAAKKRKEKNLFSLPSFFACGNPCLYLTLYRRPCSLPRPPLLCNHLIRKCVCSMHPTFLFPACTHER